MAAAVAGESVAPHTSEKRPGRPLAPAVMGAGPTRPGLHGHSELSAVQGLALGLLVEAGYGGPARAA